MFEIILFEDGFNNFDMQRTFVRLTFFFRHHKISAIVPADGRTDGDVPLRETHFANFSSRTDPETTGLRV